MRTTTRRAAILAGAGAGALLAAAAGTTAASASTTHGTVTAVTHLSGRPDSGGNGNWGLDNLKRTATLTYLGKGGPAATPYQYTATITDTSGTFIDTPGAYTPNQGGKDAGKILKPVQVSGTMSGFGDFPVFDASAKAARGLAPAAVKGANNALYPSSTWPALLFPKGTMFAGMNETDFGYTYRVPAKTITTYTLKHEVVKGKPVTVKVAHVHTQKAQDWSDTSLNGDGQLAKDGNILGR